MNIPLADITGLILAGGRGSRMGGVDKGLQSHLGHALARHAMARLQPQVGSVMINANRNLDVYASFGAAVWPDEVADYPGPLAGMLAGLTHASTAYLVTVPCDSPNFPTDLVERLWRGLDDSDAEMATAFTREDGKLRAQPVFCLMKTTLRASLAAFVAEGQRKVGLFATRHRHAGVVFEDTAAFANANTRDELEGLQGSRR